MFCGDGFRQKDEETFLLEIPENRDYKILQLTDLHLGFGLFSHKKDKMALDAVTKIINRTSPDLIVFTGDTIFPFLPKAGTMNNKKQAERFIRFIDRFKIPYTLVFGNHDCEMCAKCGREQLADIFTKGKYCIFSKGRKDIFGVGNFFINFTDKQGNVLMPLVMLDSNMYGDGWFFSGFDCIHEYFGISYKKGDFFKKAVENGIIKWMFCGHDHLNTLSLTYKGIRLTYGMSIDCLGYNGISKRYIQRGGTLITRKTDGSIGIKMIPLTRTVSTSVRGESKN